jgi:hypothetical protein
MWIPGRKIALDSSRQLLYNNQAERQAVNKSGTRSVTARRSAQQNRTVMLLNFSTPVRKRRFFDPWGKQNELQNSFGKRPNRLDIALPV